MKFLFAVRWAFNWGEYDREGGGTYKPQFTAGELLGPLEHILEHLLEHDFAGSIQTTCMEPGGIPYEKAGMLIGNFELNP